MAAIVQPSLFYKWKVIMKDILKPEDFEPGCYESSYSRCGDRKDASLPLEDWDWLTVFQQNQARRINQRNLLKPSIDYTDALREDLADPSKGALLVSAGLRTQANKNSDIVSIRDFIKHPLSVETNNQNEIQTAINYCITNRTDLYWPAGIYVSTSNIVGFHRVKHLGPGFIKRGDIIWTIDTKDWDVQALFVSVTGSPDNDGISPDFPLTYNSVNQALINAGPTLVGDWRVVFAAGTYPSAVLDIPNVSLVGKRLLKFMGPPVAKGDVPKVIFDGLNKTTIGIRCRGLQRVEIRDILLAQYTGYGFSGGDHGLWFLNNVHTIDCRIGIGGENVGLLYVSSGTHELTSNFSTSSVESHRIMSRFVVKHAIGYSYDEISGSPTIDPPDLIPKLKGSNRAGGSRGMLAQELATGHVNADIRDFAYGVDVRVSSRVHLDATSKIKSNSIGVRTGFGCNSQIQPAIDFGVGTIEENVIENVQFQGGMDTNYSQPFLHTEARVATNKGTYTVTGTTSNTRIGPILYTLSSREFKSEGSLRLRVSGTITGTVGRKTLSLMSRGTTLISAVVAASSSGQFVAELKSDVKSYGKQHGSSTWTIGGDTNNPGSSGARTRETSLQFGLEEYPIEFRVELQSSSDTVLIENIELFRLG